VTGYAQNPGDPDVVDMVTVNVHQDGDPANTTSGSDDSMVVAPAAVPPPPPPAGISIVKGGPALAHVGDTITYTFNVRLTQNSPPLSGITVTDPICDAGSLTGPSGDDRDGVLEQGENWRYTCTHTVTASDADPLPNTAEACGTAPGGRVCDRGSHSVDIVHPAITIVKTAHPTGGAPGDSIRYRFEVTNTGDVDLSDVSVDDDVLGHICDIAILLPGQTVTCSAVHAIPQDASAPIVNVATAIGTDPTGVQVSDQDRAVVDIVLGRTVTPPTKTPPGGLAFTGSSAVIPLGIVALLFFLLGSALLWASRSRGRHPAGTEGG
jgi:uncharacterized repeat protein (TIGR01451 family)